jgi:hypothetical protein
MGLFPLLIFNLDLFAVVNHSHEDVLVCCVLLENHRTGRCSWALYVGVVLTASQAPLPH